METITENSEASAETTDAETNSNANLSVQDLAASFVEKVEAQAEDPESTTEITEDVTESEVVDTEEDQEGTVLSQSDNEDSDEEAEADESQPKGLTKALKQINRLTARAKGAEEEVALLKAQVENLKTQPAQEAKTDSQPTLENVQNAKDLESLRKEAVAAKKWAQLIASCLAIIQCFVKLTGFVNFIVFTKSYNFSCIHNNDTGCQSNRTEPVGDKNCRFAFYELFHGFMNYIFIF